MSSEVIEYYTNQFNEHERHLDGFGTIQHKRTLQVLKQYLTPKQNVLDIGGATGTYSFELAKNGHHVHLLDIVPSHISKAQQISFEQGINLSGYHVGDARKLNFEDHSFDAVIIHGPLYHITKRNERLKVLKEAYRVLRNGGVLFAFAINRYAGINYGIHTGKILDDDYFKIIRTEVSSGYRDKEPGWHFHLPNELEQEVAESNFININAKGVVSPIWMLPDIENTLLDPAAQDKILRVSELLESEPILGQDFVCIGYK
ncbi:class I SAM-dependent methyltransferase [Vibrio sp. HN007]|uniref:class I SAM-dependent methyltransferase n=1 Tax=Vibrio iocasae TaxID=3098914 RepID=UPI0035D4C239